LRESRSILVDWEAWAGFLVADATHLSELGWATRAEVWCKVGALAPVDGTGCTFLGIDTRTPYLAEFDPEDSGKAVWYVLRWVSTTGQPGPWGPVFAAVVP
jgi:hypothetical protein